ncbi:MAG: sulfite exporter TauE/SafE family protein [Limibacillus sp.]
MSEAGFLSDLAWLPAEVEVWAALAMVAASFGTSFITAAFGIGGGIMLLALLAVLLPPVALIPVHGVVQVGSNLGRTLLMLRQVQTAMILPFSFGSLLGAALGGVLFIQVPPWVVQFAIAAFIVWSVLGKLPAIGRHHVFAGGAFSTFLTMFFGATGTFVAAMVRTLKLPPLEHVATHSALMTAAGTRRNPFGPHDHPARPEDHHVRLSGLHLRAVPFPDGRHDPVRLPRHHAGPPDPRAPG